MAVLETRRLTKVYRSGGEGAVRQVDLLSRDGELLVFLGPSGSGKSTLLRLIAGLEDPTSGEVHIGGRDVTLLPPRERRIAMVFQSYALYPHLTVRENIRFPLVAQRVPRAAQAAKVEWASGLLALSHLLDRTPRELSGGERQRVALARALVREPALFLLDEPLSNLDATLRATAREELVRLHAQVGTTTVYVTHDQVEAMSMGDRIVVLERGAVRQVGTPREVYEDPADTFVARFVGAPSMNLLDAGDGLILGFRPERMGAARTAEGDAFRLRLRVAHREYLGAESLLHGTIEDGRFAGSRIVVRLAAGSEGPAPGEPWEAAVPRDALRSFDAATGRRTPRPLPG